MRVIIAEDDDVFRTLISEILAQAGHTPMPERTGRLAWERLEHDGADMVVTDINMPEMDGLQLVSKIRASARHKTIPILMLTIRAFAEDQVEGYETGADDYLTKPFDHDVFIARVNTLKRRLLE